MSIEPQAPLPWTQPGWLEEASAWAAVQLSRIGARITGPVEQPHLRPWSTVLRVPADQGLFFLKASAPVLAHEPRLTKALSGWRPDCIQTVTAIDEARAWMLMPDESPMLRSLIQAPADLAHWERILPLYAGFQREMAARPAEITRLGAFDRSLTRLPVLFADLLEDREALLIDQPDGLTGEHYRQLRGLVPRFRQMCAELAESGLPATLHHDDFHDGNVFVHHGRYAFSDWGESCVTHPFFTMLVTLRSIAYRMDWPYGAKEHDYQFAPQLLYLRDVYLEAWRDYGTVADLLPVFQLAWKVAMANRALTWHQVVSRLAASERAEHASAVPGWLGEFLDALAEAG